MKEDLPQAIVVAKEYASLIEKVFECPTSKQFEKLALLIIEQEDPFIQEHDKYAITSEEKHIVLNVAAIVKACSNKPRFSAVHIAAAITSKARLALYKILLEMEDHVYYCDTDSVYTDKYLYLPSNYVDKNIIGKWKHEHTISEAFFLNPKTYAFKTKEGEEIVKAKGALLSEIDYAFVKESYHSKRVESKPEVVEINYPIHRIPKSYQLGTVNKSFVMKIVPIAKRERIFKDDKWVDTKPLAVRLEDDKNVFDA
jgi:hypothetical protein